MTSQAEVEGLRMRAAQLRAEWRSVRAAAPETRLEAEREVEAKALREEITRMEVQLMQEVSSAGGSAEDAIQAMHRAAELEKKVVESQTVEVSEDEEKSNEAFTDRPPSVHTSSDRAAAPAVPVPGHQDSPPQSDEDDEAGDEKEEEGSR